MSLPWFRFYAEFSGNPAIQSLAFEDQRHFVVLLCMKCDGTLDRPIDAKVRERIICRGLGLDPVTANEAKRRLVEVGLIAKDWQPSGWDKRQYVSDNSTNRVAKHRKNKKAGNVSETLLERSGNGPDTDTDTDEEVDEKEAQEPTASGVKSTRFVKPSVEDVAKYVGEKGYTFSPEAFVANYEAKGWKIGSSPMKSWKAACTTWQLRENERGSTAQQAQPARKKKSFEELLAGGAA